MFVRGLPCSAMLQHRLCGVCAVHIVHSKNGPDVTRQLLLEQERKWRHHHQHLDNTLVFAFKISASVHVYTCTRVDEVK
jgi:hypothetical protein